MSETTSWQPLRGNQGCSPLSFFGCFFCCRPHCLLIRSSHRGQIFPQTKTYSADKENVGSRSTRMRISHVCKATPESLKLAAPFEAEHTQDEQVHVLNSCLRSLAPVAKIDKTFISGESMAATLNFKRSNHAQIACPVHETTPAVSVFSRPWQRTQPHF